MKPFKLAIMGFGNAAKAFVTILEQKQTVLASAGLSFDIVAVSTGSRGNLASTEGLAIPQLLSALETEGHFRGLGQYISPLSTMEMIEQLEYDVMIELTPLNIFSGQPAIDHIRTALQRGKHVITANKGPIAWAYDELCALASQNACELLFETTVMDGTPIFNLVDKTLPYCKVLEIKGILNTTTNFILGHLERGEALEDIMEEGRRRGFVEADPSLDTEGWDAAAKLTALMNVLMGAGIQPKDVDRTGIGNITKEALDMAKAEGMTIKLMCHGRLTAEGIEATVRPENVPLGSLYASIDETSSVISIKTDLMGELTVVEHNPEIEQTGFGIFSDLIELSRRVNRLT